MVKIILFGLLCYGLIVAVFYVFQEKFLFFPSNIPFGECPETGRRNTTAEHAGDTRYYIRAHPNADNWLVVFHGNAGNACDRVYFLDLLKGFRSNVVLFEYPGYGKDSNSPKESLILKQALNLVRHISENNPEKLPVYLVGESLGTGVATFVASQIEVSGLILISAYTSIAKVARHHYPWLPVQYLLKHKFQADIWAGQTTTPAILFHGTDDDIIPIRFARQQILNFKGEKRLIEIPDCGHNDIINIGENVLQKEIFHFMSL